VPIHAAGVYDGPSQECCSDYVVSSYTPTLTALLRARENVRALTPERTTVLAIAAEHAQDTSMPPLRHVAQEAQHVLDIATRSGATASSLGEQAPRTEALAALQAANVVHLACHGIQHRSEPHKSRFCLSTGNITVAELMDLDLRDAFFAFLGACETAKGAQAHADEVVHLAATMLFVGFKSVVATMW
jgi:CHAT domain-containing protein